MQPSAFVLTVNTIIGQASQQLKATGHLIDGTTSIDLTSTGRRTTYASSDLTVCTLGPPDGRVFAGGNGTCTITLTNSGFSTHALGTVTSFSPTALSFLPIPGFANAVEVSGNVAYVAAGGAGLQVVDITDRAHPRLVGAVDTPGNANDVRVLGTTALVAAGVRAFGEALGAAADGFVGPSQWEPTAPLAPDLGPTPHAFARRFRTRFGVTPDYPAAQAYAAGLIMGRCIEVAGGLDRERLRAAAASLEVTTLFGPFRIDSGTGMQVGHEMLLVEWVRGRRRMIELPPSK